MRYDWSATLDPTDLAIMRQVDGQRTIGQAIATAAGSSGITVSELQARGRQLFQSLWQLDFLAMGIAS